MLIQGFQTGAVVPNSFNKSYSNVPMLGYVKPKYVIPNTEQAYSDSLARETTSNRMSGNINGEVKIPSTYKSFQVSNDQILFNDRYRFSTMGQYAKAPITGMTDIMTKPNQSRMIPGQGVKTFTTYNVPKTVPESDWAMIYNSIKGNPRYDSKYDMIEGIPADWIKANQL